MNGPISVNPEQMKARISELKATVALKKALIEAKERENLAWRVLVYSKITKLEQGRIFPEQTEWTDACRAAWFAEKDILKLEVSKIEGEIQLCEGLLRDAKPNPKLYVPQ